MQTVTKIIAVLFIGILVLINGCRKEPRNDGSQYKTVKIGSQIWMAENLNADRFRNGDIIPEAKSEQEWIDADKKGKPAWCYFDNKPMNSRRYGKLYNWYSVNDKRGLAPMGWHIPTVAEFETLKTVVKKDGNALKAKGQGTGYGVGTNTSKFSVLLAGYRDMGSTFYDLGNYTRFWSATEHTSFTATNMYLWSRNSNIFFDWYYKGYGLSVRCVKD